MKQKRYSESFKKRMVERMVGARRVSASELSREVGVPQPTLSLWLKSSGIFSVVKDDEPRAPTRRPDDWTPREKLAAVLDSAGVTNAELGAWLRRKGLTEEHLRQWRAALEERASAVFAPAVRRPLGESQSRKQVKDLERELKRKEKALAETAALLVLQGKVKALWAAEDEPTRPSSDEVSSKPSRQRKHKGRR